MNPSLPVLPATTTVPEALPGTGENSVVNQSETGQSSEFGALLDNQFATLSEPLAPVIPATVDAGERLTELQHLPPGGKRLPLLQETLDLTALPDRDDQPPLQPLSVKSERLDPAEAEVLIPSLPEAIQLPIAGEAAVLPLPGQADAAVLQGRLAGFVNQQMRPSGRPPITELSLSRSLNTPAMQQAVGESPVLQASLTDPDKAMQQLQLAPQAPEGRQSDLALLLSAFKRQQVGGAQQPDAGSRAAAAEPGSVAGAAVASVTPSATLSSSVLPTTSIQTAFGQANWDQSVGERIQWMVGQKMQAAQVKLNPANLGPMEVRIQIQNDQASVQFSAHQAVVREALEAAMPRLREMFEASGVELVDADVSGHAFAEQQTADSETGENARGSAAEATDADAAQEPLLDVDVASIIPAGRVDLFV